MTTKSLPATRMLLYCLASQSTKNVKCLIARNYKADKSNHRLESYYADE